MQLYIFIAHGGHSDVNDLIASKKCNPIARNSAKLCSSTMSRFMKKKEFGSDEMKIAAADHADGSFVYHKVQHNYSFHQRVTPLSLSGAPCRRSTMIGLSGRGCSRAKDVGGAGSSLVRILDSDS